MLLFNNNGINYNFFARGVGAQVSAGVVIMHDAALAVPCACC
jgi:hypothetical protein